MPTRNICVVFFFMACLVLAMGLQIGCGKPTTLSQKRLVIATGSKSGVYYPVGEALAKIVKEAFADVQVEVLVTEGSPQNVALLQEGKANLALVQNDIAHYALYGENMYTGKKVASLTGLATLFPEVVHIIGRKEAGIQDLKDLAGKKIAVGTEGSGSYFNAQQVFSQAKIWDSLQKSPLPPSDGLTELEKGNIDALVFSTGLKNSRITELAHQKPLSFIALPTDLIQDLVNSYPFYFPSEIPLNTYPGIASEVPGIEINSLLVTNTSCSEDDIYLITKTLFGSLEVLKSAHPALSNLTHNSLRRQMSIPFAPSAFNALSEQ